MVGFLVKASLLIMSSLCLSLVQRKREGVKSCYDPYRSRTELREPLEDSSLLMGQCGLGCGKLGGDSGLGLRLLTFGVCTWIK